MKTTINMNNYLLKGIVIMGIALALQSVISLHKSTFYEAGKEKVISNFSPKGNNANAFMVAMTENSKKSMNSSTSSSSAATTDFTGSAELEKNLIEAAGLNSYKPYAESVESTDEASYAENNLEELMIRAAGLDKFMASNFNQHESNFTDESLEQSMTNAAGIYQPDQDITDSYATGDEVDYQALEENMIRAAGLGDNNLQFDSNNTSNDNDSVEFEMIRAAGLYQVHTVTE